MTEKHKTFKTKVLALVLSFPERARSSKSDTPVKSYGKNTKVLQISTSHRPATNIGVLSLVDEGIY